MLLLSNNNIKHAASFYLQAIKKIKMPTKEKKSANSFAHKRGPSKKSLVIIKQFARTYRPIQGLKSTDNTFFSN